MKEKKSADLFENFIRDYDSKRSDDETDHWKTLNIILAVFLLIIVYTISRTP